MKRHKHIPFRPWTRAEVLEVFRDRVRRKLPMNVSKVKAEFSYLPRVVIRMFGKWTNIFDILGIKPPRWGTQWTCQKVISEMRKIYQLPSPARVRLHHRLSHLWQVALRYFPSRAVIYEKFGFPQRKLWSRPRIIKYLQNRVKRHQLIHTTLILRENRFFYRAARYHFGSYQKAVKAAGIVYQASPIKSWHYRKARSKE